MSTHRAYSTPGRDQRARRGALRARGGRLSCPGQGEQQPGVAHAPSAVAARIARHLDERGSPPAGAALLVTNCDRARKGDGRLTASGIFRRVVHLARLAGVSHRVSPQGRRHTSATAALDTIRGDVWRVRKFSWHAKIETSS